MYYTYQYYQKHMVSHSLANPVVLSSYQLGYLRRFHHYHFRSSITMQLFDVIRLGIDVLATCLSIFWQYLFNVCWFCWMLKNFYVVCTVEWEECRNTEILSSALFGRIWSYMCADSRIRKANRMSCVTFLWHTEWLHVPHCGTEITPQYRAALTNVAQWFYCLTLPYTWTSRYYKMLWDRIEGRQMKIKDNIFICWSKGDILKYLSVLLFFSVP